MERSGKTRLGLSLNKEVEMIKKLLELLICTAVVCTSCQINLGNKDSVPENEDKKKAWTILVYMAADNDLESAAIRDINEMEAGFNENGDCRILVLFDRTPGFDGTNEDWSDTRLLEIKKDKQGLNNTLVSKRLSCPELDLSLDRNTELDMGNPSTLQGFIDFSERKYKAENTVLIIWGHGSGWRSAFCSEISRAVGIDDSSDSFLSVPEMGLALKNKKLNAVIFDTCFGAVIENLYEIKDSFEYLVGTAGITSLWGLDYESFLESFSETDKTDDALVNSILKSSETELSVLRGSKMDEVQKTFNDFSKELALYIDSAEKRNQIMEWLFQEVKSFQSYTYPCDLYLDMKSLSSRFMANENINISSLASELNNALEECFVLGDQLGVHFIPLVGRNVAASKHSDYYFYGIGGNKCAFVNDTPFWVPGNSGESLLDKIFYESF